MAAEGTFILADIGGYTPFLTGVGIEHAKEITSDLFNGMLKVNRGRWKIANIEGDCIFFYREGREASNDLMAHIKALFAEFCERVIDIAASSACECGACTRVNQLSLKFIVHAGGYDTQKIGRRQELIGTDIVIVHRLLKKQRIVGRVHPAHSQVLGLGHAAGAAGTRGSRRLRGDRRRGVPVPRPGAGSR